MSYSDRFVDLDALVVHMDTILPAISDQVLVSQYVGFLCVTVVTVFELSIKDIFLDFSSKKHQAFGVYCGNVIEKMNGRISIKDLRDDHIRKFGQKYVRKFTVLLDACERRALAGSGQSVKAAYGNVLVWRNSFAHQGILPANANYDETRNGYSAGKDVMACLASAMRR